MATVDILDAFGYKWAQDGTVEALTDTQWKAGWSFIGATPPSVEQFNKWGQIADEKSNYLYGQISSIFTAMGSVPAAGTATTLRDALRGRLIARRVFTGTQVYTPTVGTTSVDVLVVGGGGGGGGSQSTVAATAASGAGGGGAGWARRRITAAFSGVTITVGAAGIGGITTNPGTAGGTSSFGALLSATGGAGGPFGPQQSVASNASFTLGIASQGVGSLGDMNGDGEYGGWAFYASNPQSGKGGSSIFGGGGVWRTGYATGGDGQKPGAGGGGGNSPPSFGGATGGNGLQGVVIVDEYA